MDGGCLNDIRGEVEPCRTPLLSHSRYFHVNKCIDDNYCVVSPIVIRRKTSGASKLQASPVAYGRGIQRMITLVVSQLSRCLRRIYLGDCLPFDLEVELDVWSDSENLGHLPPRCLRPYI